MIGGREASEKALSSMWEKQGLKLKGSPDYFIFKEPLFGVGDARRLNEQALTKAFIDRKVFFIAPEKITLEAQNALLKTFEEPIEKTHFFLALRDENLVIPTLRSRMQKLNVQHSVLHKRTEEFLGLSIKERLNFVKKFIDKEENLSLFLDELLLTLRERAEGREALEKVYRVRLGSDDRGASSRVILEHLALVL